MHTTLLEIYTLLLQIDLMSYMTLTEDFVLMVAIASPAANYLMVINLILIISQGFLMQSLLFL